MSWNCTPKNAKEAMEIFKASIDDIKAMVQANVFSADEGAAKMAALKEVLNRELQALQAGTQFERQAQPLTQGAAAAQAGGGNDATGAEKAIQELYAEYVGPKSALSVHKEAYSYLRNIASCPNTLVREAITEHVHRDPANELLRQLFAETSVCGPPVRYASTLTYRNSWRRVVSCSVVPMELF